LKKFLKPEMKPEKNIRSIKMMYKYAEAYGIIHYYSLLYRRLP